MKDPKIKAKVVHSLSKDAWNVVTTTLSKKFKLARVPYLVLTGETNKTNNRRHRQEALEIAEFICYAFNNSEKLCKDETDIKS